MYILYSLKMQGYWNGSNYTSDLTQALRFQRVDAIIFAARRYDERGHGLLPVALEDLTAVKEFRS